MTPSPILSEEPEDSYWQEGTFSTFRITQIIHKTSNSCGKIL